MRAVTGIDGGTLREWRRSRGWDVPKTARELRHVASEPVAAPDALVRMIRGWERGDHELSERYELLYRRLGTHDASVWSFPPARQALFSLSVALHTGDAVGALGAAATAEADWKGGAPKVLATWAQVRAGAAMAYLMLDSLDGAAAQIVPVLELAPEMRIDTVTGYLQTLDQMLSQPCLADSAMAAALRQQISDFISAPAAC